MAEIAVKNWRNQVLRTIALDAEVFDYPLKPHLIYEAVCAYRAGGRAGTHKTKNRVDVSGGTKKLWRQKGTGRARVGDNRSPLWRHGGTVHGPVPRDYSWGLPRRMRRNALRSALAEKHREGRLICLETLALGSHKTKDLARSLRADLGIDAKTLLLPLESESNLALAARNIRGLSVVRALGVSIVDLLDHDTVVISEDALGRLSEVLRP
jgi:large subunit ribosomal protein L4